MTRLAHRQANAHLQGGWLEERTEDRTRWRTEDRTRKRWRTEDRGTWKLCLGWLRAPQSWRVKGIGSSFFSRTAFTWGG